MFSVLLQILLLVLLILILVLLIAVNCCWTTFAQTFIYKRLAYINFDFIEYTKYLHRVYTFFLTTVYGECCLYVRYDQKSASIITHKQLPFLNRATHLRFVCISDTHEAHEQLHIPPGDVLIHCGDILVHNSKFYKLNPEKTIEILRQINFWF